MDLFRNAAPVPEQWVSGKLPANALQHAVTATPSMMTDVEMVFPGSSREEAELLRGLHSALPELGSVSVLTILCYCVGMCNRIRSHCGKCSQLLEFLEFFCGSAAISRACCLVGMKTKAFDIGFGSEARWDHCGWAKIAES